MLCDGSSRLCRKSRPSTRVRAPSPFGVSVGRPKAVSHMLARWCFRRARTLMHTRTHSAASWLPSVDPPFS
eukprot:1644427-Alexandrium_andersonii.AAC.1